MFLSPHPAQRAATVSGEVSVSGMQPQFVVVGEQTVVSIQGSAFSAGTEIQVNAGGFEVAAWNVQLVSPELLVGSVTLPEEAVGSVSVTVRRPDGSTATLPSAGQAQEFYWGLETSDGVRVSGKFGSGVPLWIDESAAARPLAQRAGAGAQGISDCERIPFCTVPINNLLGFWFTSNDLPNICPATLAQNGERIESTSITYFVCSSGPCSPSSPNLVKNLDVALKVRPRYWTGGHCHSEPDRPGGPPPESVAGNTGPTGLGFIVAHRWPDVAGAMNVIFYSTGPEFQFNQAQDTSYIYCLRGAQVFASFDGNDPGYQLIGGTTPHPLNHFGVPMALRALKELALDVQATLPWASPLKFNDISLSSGGLFDHKVSINPAFAWKKPHCGHRAGREVDLRIIEYPNEADKLDKLQAIIEKNGFTVLREKDPPHWHLSYTFPN